MNVRRVRVTGKGPDGTDGAIDPDTASLTSALNIVKKITIDIR